MEPEDKQAFVVALSREHGARLRRFLAARLRDAAQDVPDLIQEIYLRLLRVPQHNALRSPQAYLFTVAHHVLHQHQMNLASIPESVEVTDALADVESQVDVDPARQLETRQRLEALEQVLNELPDRPRATFLLHRRDGYTLEEIAVRFGVSRPMVKKYLAKAIAHCKERYQEMG